MGPSNLLPSSSSNMSIDVSGDQPNERSSSLSPAIKEDALQLLGWSSEFDSAYNKKALQLLGWSSEFDSAYNKKALQLLDWCSEFDSAYNKKALQLFNSPYFYAYYKKDKILEDISKLKTGYHKREGTELEKVLDIWREINLLEDEERETVMPHFSSRLRFLTGNGIRPRTPSDHIFRDHCLALLREVDAYKDLNGVNQYLRRAQILKCSTGEASSSRRTTNIGVAGDGPMGEGSGRSGGGLSDSTIQPPVEDHVAVAIDPLAANSFSLGTTARRNTSPGQISMNIDMGDGRRRDQEPKMKEFRTFAYVTIPLFITIQVSLLSANRRQPEVLFRSCGRLVTGATICSIGMLVLVLMGPSSKRALIFLKMLQLLIIGLLFAAAILVFTLL